MIAIGENLRPSDLVHQLAAQVAVTLCYRIQADRDRLLVAGTVRADVPSRFPHGSEGRSIGSFIGTGGGDYLRKAP
jgi:hypothetical protein